MSVVPRVYIMIAFFLLGAVAKSAHAEWRLNTSLSLPFRSFELQSGGRDAEGEPLDRLTYLPSPSLEGSVSIAYKFLGFSYRHTLASGSLDGSYLGDSSSQNEEYRFSVFLKRDLFEVSYQNIVGMKTNFAVDKFNIKSIARPDISFSDVRVRWVGGTPLWGESVNSLANYYTEVQPTDGWGLDVLYDLEFIRQKMSGSSPFIPKERDSQFDSAAYLKEVSSSGLGAGAGLGLTAKMSRRSCASMAFLVGGNFNLSKAVYIDGEKDISGFGAFGSFRISSRWSFGEGERQNIGVRLIADTWSIPAQRETVASSDAALSLTYGATF